nr:hypothetical protein [Caldicellulosiruptor naganoensis]
MAKIIKFFVLLVIVSLWSLNYCKECYAGLKCDTQITAKSAIAIEWTTGKILF